MRKRLIQEKGATMSEYGLLLALLAIFAVAALMLLGPKLREVFDEITRYLSMRP